MEGSLIIFLLADNHRWKKAFYILLSTIWKQKTKTYLITNTAVTETNSKVREKKKTNKLVNGDFQSNNYCMLKNKYCMLMIIYESIVKYPNILNSLDPPFHHDCYFPKRTNDVHTPKIFPEAATYHNGNCLEQYFSEYNTYKNGQRSF